MTHPYRPEPPPPIDPAEWAKELWPVQRKAILGLWFIVLGYTGIVGLLRWIEWGHPWPALWQFTYWLPTLPVVYFTVRWVYFKWPPEPPSVRRR